MDRGRNLGVLAEEDSEEEEVDEGHKREGSSDESESDDDDEPDPSSRREPNKFDNLCDGVTNTMAYVHGAMQELLNMKDEMLKHSLPPTLLIKLATVTGKVFRSVSDLNMPVNELVRLVRVYSTPWEEKSAALKKLHEDYENKQRQLNIAVKRLQLVDAHSKRIAREKRIMNWEKLFAKIMSNRGHGRRWKFLIETIKQKAKLGLEHVQEYTRALEESSDEEDDEEDDMPMTIKRPGEDSDKLSDLEEGEEDDEKTSTGKDSSEDTEKSDKEEDSTRIGSPKKVRFASPEEPAVPVYVKPATSDAEAWTGEQEYDHFLYCRVYQPTKVEEQELKCIITLGEQIKKTKRIDAERPVSQPQPEKEKEEAKPKGRGLIGMRAKPAEDKMAQFKKEAEQRKAEQEAKTRYQEIFFEIPEYFGNDSLWRKGKENEPKSLKLSVHKGPTEEMFAMATIDLDDIFDQEVKTVYFPEPHGDDDVPPPPGERPEEGPGTTKPTTPKTENGAPVEKHEILKKVEPLHFPIFALNPKKTDNVHEPCGNVPIVFYMAKRARPKVWNRNNGTVPFNDLVLDIAGIDLETWKKEDFFKETESRAASAMEWQPEVQVKVVEKEVIKEVIVQAEPKIIEVMKTPPPPPPESPKEDEGVDRPVETVPKVEYDKLINKHSEELQLVQAEYEKRLQQLLESLQQMQQTQLEQKELLMQQQQQQQSRPPLVHQRPVSSSSKRSSASGARTSAPPPKSPSQLQPSSMVSPSLGVSQEINMLPKTPQTYDTLTPIGYESRTENQSVTQLMPDDPFSRKNRKVLRPIPMGSNVPEDFLTRLAWFEETSKRHQQENQEKTMRTIQEELEKKLAGQNKLSRPDEGLYDAMKDVSLPALFMPTENKKAAIYNPRAHQYFHPTGSSDLRLSQPPSVFQLPPLPPKSRMSVVNLFELSRNFNRKDQAWLMDKYIAQQEPLQNVQGTAPHTPAPTLTQTPFNDPHQCVREGTPAKDKDGQTET